MPVYKGGGFLWEEIYHFQLQFFVFFYRGGGLLFGKLASQALCNWINVSLLVGCSYRSKSVGTAVEVEITEWKSRDGIT